MILFFFLTLLVDAQVVCAPGSVDVEEAKKIIRQKRVQHLYSRINGRLSSKFDGCQGPSDPQDLFTRTLRGSQGPLHKGPKNPKNALQGTLKALRTPYKGP